MPRSANAAHGVKSDTVTARDVATRDCFVVVIRVLLLNRSLPSSSSSNAFVFFSASHRRIDVVDVPDASSRCAVVWTTTTPTDDDDEPKRLFFRDEKTTPGRKKDVGVVDDNAITCIGSVVLWSASGAFFDDL